jgi:hypothetical protein
MYSHSALMCAPAVFARASKAIVLGGVPRRPVVVVPTMPAAWRPATLPLSLRRIQ